MNTRTEITAHIERNTIADIEAKAARAELAAHIEAAEHTPPAAAAGVLRLIVEAAAAVTAAEAEAARLAEITKDRRAAWVAFLGPGQSIKTDHGSFAVVATVAHKRVTAALLPHVPTAAHVEAIEAHTSHTGRLSTKASAAAVARYMATRTA